MDRQKLAVVFAYVVLGATTLVLGAFVVIALISPILGDSGIGEFFLMVIRQEGGFTDLAKQAVLPVVALFTTAIDLSKLSRRVFVSLIILSAVAMSVIIVFCIFFQINSYSDEIWVRDVNQAYESQEAFEATVRGFCYQLAGGLLTYIIVIFGLRPKQEG